MSNAPLIEDVSLYTVPNNENNNEKTEPSAVHIDVDDQPHVMGIRPFPHHKDINLPTIEAIEGFKHHSQFEFSNILWSCLFGWWISLIFVVLGILFCITIFFYKHGLFCFRTAHYILYPFGKIAVESEPKKQSIQSLIVWIIFSPILILPLSIAMLFSWEFVFYIPMAKLLFNIIAKCFTSNPEYIHYVKPNQIIHGKNLFMCNSSGSWFYFKFTIFGFEVVYLNFIPFILISLIVGFGDMGNTFLADPIFGSIMSLMGAMPCAYFIGVCVDDLSKHLGIVLGAILNSTFLTIVELILYYFSLQKGLVDITRAAITGAFLMNLLIIPGFAMLFAGFKWKETILNRKAQSVGGTFLLLAIISVLFPSVFYHIHSHTRLDCSACSLIGDDPGNQTFNCSSCYAPEFDNIIDDPIYQDYAAPLMYTMAILMPIIFITSVIFSVKTHSHIYRVEVNEHENEGMSQIVALIILAMSTVGFSLMAHVMTEKIPEALEKLHFSQRFVGLIFYTLIPNAAEYMNAIKFALNGNIGLSMEIGNQGAILTALIEMPALVLISLILHVTGVTKEMFTLVFPMIDIFCIIVAVLLRNSILTEKSVNYFTGLSFLIIFLLIAVVY